MYPHEQQDHDDGGPPRGRHNLDLWFYERRGSRYYLRITRLGLLIFVIPIIFSIAAIFLLFIYNSNESTQINPDITITVPTQTGTPVQLLIKQPTPLPRTSNVRITPPRSIGNVSSTPIPHKNTNE